VKTGIILVGGEARRAGGKEKYFFMYRGQTFIERLISTLRTVVDEVILVARDTSHCGRFSEIEGVRIVHDRMPGLGPLGGIHAGVEEASGDLLFVVACDMPCVDAGVIKELFSRIDRHDAVIPAWDKDRLEPLHAIYRRSAIQNYLGTHKSLSLRAMVHNLDSVYVDVEELRSIDPDLGTFININKLEDLEAISGGRNQWP